jgi:CRISPR-associated protein Cas2
VETRVSYLVTYNIANDDRREELAVFLSGYGPRVQLSVFEVELADAAAATCRETLVRMIDAEDDQIRLYRMAPEAISQRLIYGPGASRNVPTSGSSKMLPILLLQGSGRSASHRTGARTGVSAAHQPPPHHVVAQIADR